MERYDQQDKPVDRTGNVKNSDNKREYVNIDQEHMATIVELFLKNLSDITLKNSDIKLVKTYDIARIVFNSEVSLEQLSNTIGKPFKSKLEFVREYYLYKLDEFIDMAYDKKVTAIQEYPYSFRASEQNSDIIIYEFIN